MTGQQFREAIRAQPFRPFTIHLVDGRHYTVVHREYASVGPNNRTAFVYRHDGIGELIDLLLVVGLEFQSPAETESPAL